MDHTHHSSMGTAPSGPTCSMHMLFTWNTENLCLVFRWWHVSGTLTLILSLLAVVALSAGYEYLRAFTRCFEARVDTLQQSTNQETSSLISGSTPPPQTSNGVCRSRTTSKLCRKEHVIKATLYGLQVFYSFFIMLLFMTYNGWVMIAVAVGASVGYCLWGGASAAKSVACH